MRVVGKNFQSWSNFDLTIDGLTALVGPSDLGKSATFRAMRAVTRNDFPEAFIKHGKSESSVSLLDGAFEATISRTLKGSPKYDINGEEYKKLSGGVPEDISSLGFGGIVLGDLELDPIFAGQFDPQFGITLKPTQLNQLLGAFASTEKLEAGKKEVNRRISESNSEAKLVAGELVEVEKDLARLRILEEAATKVSASLEAREVEVASLEAKVSHLETHMRISDSLSALTDVVSHLSPVDLGEVRRLHGVSEALETLNSLGRSLSACDTILEDLKAPEVNLTKELGILSSLETLTSVGTRLNAIPDIPAVDTTRVAQDMQILRALEEYGNLANKLNTASETLNELDTKLESIHQELHAAQKELQGMTLTTCPQCGYKWREDGH